ncbi:MAG TPA: transketolase [Synergistaceae bacterium]|jgi:transketolase|nr:MAG: Transketolase domain-containing protein [Synergistales bacterium 53_16]KUL02627.1 MAG: Transketolase domain-containing protein [Synergistales bacterium 54_9]MDK2846615.1 transketolase [Synergistales bacterium]HAA47616.1 transketolase [Synergistaceae bacterium]MDN5336238.1 transketolase [Synergistales bacterium]
MEEKARQRLETIALTIRRHIISMLAAAGSGHPGGSLSAVEILVSLYFEVMRHDPGNPAWEERDRFILSKGHACPVVYATLAEAGYFPVEELQTLRAFGSRLQGHPDRKKLPCLEASTGSLGQGLSIASGMALGFKMDSKPNRVYCLMGDGELDEGQIWEAAMTAAHYKLDNLCGIVDRNGLQIDGWTCDVKSLEPLADKWRAFGWNVIEVDGHNVCDLVSAFGRFRHSHFKPTVIIAHTVKGKGVKPMENEAGWHGKAPDADLAERILEELDGGGTR